MAALTDLPPVMANVREDLLSLVSGRFSPEDWDAIVAKAAVEFARRRREMYGSDADQRAWQAVVLEFNQSGYWGFRPDYRPPKKRPSPNSLGVRFIVMAFVTMTITKIAVLWIGQIYARSDEGYWLYILIGLIVLILANFGYFLWRNRRHED